MNTEHVVLIVPYFKKAIVLKYSCISPISGYHGSKHTIIYVANYNGIIFRIELEKLKKNLQEYGEFEK